jgi:ribosomal protein S18 acetylase RimI-like enzyme
MSCRPLGGPVGNVYYLAEIRHVIGRSRAIPDGMAVRQVDTENTAALALYLSLGFEPVASLTRDPE